jgi:hypothetical protein
MSGRVFSAFVHLRTPVAVTSTPPSDRSNASHGPSFTDNAIPPRQREMHTTQGGPDVPDLSLSQIGQFDLFIGFPFGLRERGQRVTRAAWMGGWGGWCCRGLFRPVDYLPEPRRPAEPLILCPLLGRNAGLDSGRARLVGRDGGAASGALWRHDNHAFTIAAACWSSAGLSAVW